MKWEILVVCGCEGNSVQGIKFRNFYLVPYLLSHELPDRLIFTPYRYRPIGDSFDMKVGGSYAVLGEIGNVLEHLFGGGVNRDLVVVNELDIALLL